MFMNRKYFRGHIKSTGATHLSFVIKYRFIMPNPPHSKVPPNQRNLNEWTKYLKSSTYTLIFSFYFSIENRTKLSLNFRYFCLYSLTFFFHTLLFNKCKSFHLQRVSNRNTDSIRIIV